MSGRGTSGRPAAGRPEPGRRKGLVLGAALGDCVHVAGVLHFLEQARVAGFETHFLGPAVPVRALVEAIERLEPAIVGCSYRLGPETVGPYLEELADRLGPLGRTAMPRPVLVFGGTEPVCRVARSKGLFTRVFSSSATAADVAGFLESAGGAAEVAGEAVAIAGGTPAEPSRSATEAGGGRGGLVERISKSRPWPIYRHHFGLPSLEATVEGCARLAESGLVDVISLGPDQNTQERFFHPDEIVDGAAGAGGVPIRTREDFARLRQAARRGNRPLMRCYSGTRDILELAAVLHETIDNAWCAVPLFWYNVLDARSDRPLRASIEENMRVVAWHAERGIPVEVNEAHHWSLREAPDAVAVVAAYLAAYNAKARGVRHYVSQYMFNTPAGTEPAMDLGKMLAKIELIERLHDETFTTYRQVRAGLASFPADPAAAKGHLAAATYVQMALRPHIVHVVAYCEADHAATPPEIEESVAIVRSVVGAALAGQPRPEAWPGAIERKEELLAEARELLDAVAGLAPPGTPDPLTDTETLARAVESGLLDAPHLAGNSAAAGRVRTRMVDGKCLAVDPETGRPIGESERIRRALQGATPAGVTPAGAAPVSAAFGRSA